MKDIAISGAPAAGAEGDVWPGPDYWQRIERLKQAVGQTIYLAEVKSSEINLSVTMENRGFELLAVLDFPKPDPSRNLYPHLLLLDDGRGVNMGQIARVSLERPFQPAAEDILYSDAELLEALMYCERSLGHEKVQAISKQALGDILGAAGSAPSLGGRVDAARLPDEKAE